MDFQEYTKRRLAAAHPESMDIADRLNLSGLGLTGEAGEFADLIKKHNYHGRPLDRVSALLELGDVLWYIMYAANALDSSLQEVAELNDAKLAKRYPNGFVEGGGIR